MSDAEKSPVSSKNNHQIDLPGKLISFQSLVSSELVCSFFFQKNGYLFFLEILYEILEYLLDTRSMGLDDKASTINFSHPKRPP